MYGTTIILVIYLAIFICIPALIGVYVFRDAKDRGMNTALWTLIAVLAPLLIGFIVYLLVRGSYSNLKCPKCAATVTGQYHSCPNCGAKLRPACPNCSAPVEAGWKVCPICAVPLPEHFDDISEPVKKKDKALGKIIAAVLLIPVLLIVVMVLSYSTFTASSGKTGFTSLSVDEYLRAADRPQIEEWLSRCGGEYGKAYVLRQESRSDGQVTVNYLIYTPRLTDLPKISAGTVTGLFGRRLLKIEIAERGGSGGNTLLFVTCSGDRAPELKLYYDGKRITCEITDVDYPIGLTDQTGDGRNGATPDNQSGTDALHEED